MLPPSFLAYSLAASPLGLLWCSLAAGCEPMADILSEIDDAISDRCCCGCGETLDPNGPSAYYVDADHQRRWQDRQATDPIDVYRRPDAHIDLFYEGLRTVGRTDENSPPVPSTTFRRLRPESWRAGPLASHYMNDVTFNVADPVVEAAGSELAIAVVTWDSAGGMAALAEQVGLALSVWQRDLLRYLETVHQFDATLRAGRAETDPPTDPMERALWLRKHRNTGPAAQRRVPRQIEPRRSRR